VLVRDVVDGAPAVPVLCPHDDRIYALEVLNADGHHVWIVDEHTGGVRQAMSRAGEGEPLVDFDALPASYYSGRLRWCPLPLDSGAHAFVFVSTAESESAELYVGNTDSRHVVRITDGSAVAGPAEWSVDGDGVYYVGVAEGRSVLRYVAGVRDIAGNTTGGGTVELPESRLPVPEPGDGVISVSSDGRWVAFVVRGDGESSGADIWVAATKGTWGANGAFRLTRLSGDETRPVWSPSGRWIAFYHAPERRSPTIEILCARVEFPSPTGRRGWVSAPAIEEPHVTGYLEIGRDLTGETATAPVWVDPGSAAEGTPPDEREWLIYLQPPDPAGHNALEIVSPDRTERGLPARGTMTTSLDVILGVAMGPGRAVVCGQRGNHYSSVRVELTPPWEAEARHRLAGEGSLR
jgi:hypothetical protein